MAAHSTPTDLLRNSTVQSLQNLALYIRHTTTSTVPNLTSNAPADTQAQTQLQTQAQARVQD